ncbi:hypothetical protein [Modicisalibacter luteus]|uniref:Uncharacterized protein n=2 Tax=Modicisalibacter luteus TaxID=453962 RepID=A0ABV7M5N0_9GAMM|nr:hypothetical protein [Halomonas lutea]
MHELTGRRRKPEGPDRTIGTTPAAVKLMFGIFAELVKEMRASHKRSSILQLSRQPRGSCSMREVETSLFRLKYYTVIIYFIKQDRNKCSTFCLVLDGKDGFRPFKNDFAELGEGRLPCDHQRYS